MEKKYHCEELQEAANDWFATIGRMQDDIILLAYMKEKNIKEEEVEW